jgi:hypothetical protein
MSDDRETLRVSSGVEEMFLEQLVRQLLAAYEARDSEAGHKAIAELQQLIAFIDGEVSLGVHPETPPEGAPQ